MPRLVFLASVQVSPPCLIEGIDASLEDFGGRITFFKFKNQLLNILVCKPRNTHKQNQSNYFKILQVVNRSHQSLIFLKTRVSCWKKNA